MSQIRALVWKDVGIHGRTVAIYLVGGPIVIRVLMQAQHTMGLTQGQSLASMVVPTAIAFSSMMAIFMAQWLIEPERGKATFAWIRSLQRLQVRHPLVRADARDDQDGRRPRAPALQARVDQRVAPVLHRHPEERRFARRPGREVPQQVRPPRREEVSPATLGKRQLRLPFLCPPRARNRRRGRLLHHSRSPPRRPRELAQPRPRQPARSRAAAAAGAPHPLRRLRPAGAVRPRPVEERRHHGVRLHRQHRPGQDLAGSRRRWAACRPTARCCRTGSAPSSSSCEPWLDPALAARIPFALLLALALSLPGTPRITWRAPNRRSRCPSPSAAKRQPPTTRGRSPTARCSR